MIRIVEIADITCQGATEPVVCRGEDGHEYVAKGSFAGRKALVAEWVAGRLGHLLKLPIPPFEQLFLDPRLADYSVKEKEVARLGRGVLFGSRRDADVVELRDADIPRVAETLRARVLAFDHWVANADRVFRDGRGNPNLLWSEADERLVVIDHNLAFRPTSMDGFWSEHAFRGAGNLWSDAFCREMEAGFRDALARLPGIWDEMPAEWTEDGMGIPFDEVQSLLWRFERSADTFWRVP